MKWGKAAVMAGLPPRLPPSELFDVYKSHTSNCAVCLNALKNVKKTRNYSLILAAVAIGVLKTLKAKLLVGGFFGIVSVIAHNLMKLFYKYEFSHQNNP